MFQLDSLAVYLCSDSRRNIQLGTEQYQTALHDVTQYLFAQQYELDCHMDKMAYKMVDYKVDYKVAYKVEYNLVLGSYRRLDNLVLDSLDSCCHKLDSLVLGSLVLGSLDSYRMLDS